ncbi:hypothetical protein [Actinomycetospora soli]|uniref:hypothetical protein n=1 Tax=Actinomycetospora soli TaxID=2893887 RepID=UPI001E3C2A97|nr:hypothetical protein [Actinomycetospora soli]MCD2191656.1 hypothetical protein [Actinomycetospora soli]
MTSQRRDATSSEQQIVAAYRAGRASWQAHGIDVPCPWNGRGPTTRERVLAVAWRRGRLSGVDPAFRGATG